MLLAAPTLTAMLDGAGRRARSLLWLAALAGCASGLSPEGDRLYTRGLAQVERVEVSNSPVTGVRARVRIQGQLPDGCSELGSLDSRRSVRGFELTLYTRRPNHGACPQALVPFDESYLIGIAALLPGVHEVSVNGVRTTFQVLPDPSDPFPAEDPIENSLFP